MTNFYNNSNYYDSNVPIFTFVSNIDQAKSFSLPPNRSALLMDSSKAVFYWKETNLTGQSIFKVFEFHEISEPQPPQYITTDDFEKFKRELVSLIKGDNNNEPDISKAK